MRNRQKFLGAFALAMINVSAICSIRNWPVAAEYGFSSLFLMLLAAVIFFIPVALVSADLGTGWPKAGGIFAWVKEAFGHQWGFLAVWYLWLTNIPWYPTLLSFIAGTIAFTFKPELANQKVYALIMILSLFWTATILNLKGMKTSSWISTISVLTGTILPGVVIIALGLSYMLHKSPLQIRVSWDAFFPKIDTPNQLVLLTGILFSFAGIEMSAVHAKEMVRPQKTYPRAIFLSALIIFLISALGTLAIAIVTPQEEISFISGALDSLSYFFNTYNLGFLIPVIAICVAIGSFGQMSTWIAGPSKGLLEAAKYGDLPSIFNRTNKRGVPTSLILLQGIIVSFLALVFLFMPSVTSSFWLLTALTAQYYLLLYILMFIAAIYLKFKKPNVYRSYRIPGGKIGMCVVAGIGIISCTLAFFIGFIPPSQIDTGGLLFYGSFLIIGVLLGSFIPSILIWVGKKKSLKKN